MDNQNAGTVYKTPYYAAMRRKKILPFVTTCIELEGIMLSDISQCCCCSFNSLLTYHLKIEGIAAMENGMEKTLNRTTV